MRIRMMSSKKELFQLHKDSTDIYKRNILDRYLIRQKDAVFENLCYALFIKRYQMQTKPTENDSQPEELVDNLFEENHSSVNAYPDVLILSSRKKLHYCKVQFYEIMSPVNLRTYRSMQINYFFMFCPFQNECEAKIGQPLSYKLNLTEPAFLKIIKNL